MPRRHLLSAAARTFLRGPHGMGFHYARRGIIEQLQAISDLHAASWTRPDRYVVRANATASSTPWGTNSAAELVFGGAVEYAQSWGLDAIEDRMSSLTEELHTTTCG